MCTGPPYQGAFSVSPLAHCLEANGWDLVLGMNHDNSNQSQLCPTIPMGSCSVGPRPGTRSLVRLHSLSHPRSCGHCFNLDTDIVQSLVRRTLIQCCLPRHKYSCVTIKISLLVKKMFGTQHSFQSLVRRTEV